MVYDAQYTADEYENLRIGWGDTPIEYAVQAASRAGVKRLALFHHDPDRTDGQLEELAKTYCQRGSYGETEVFFAKEGVELEF